MSENLPVEVHRIGVNAQTYDHQDPYGKTWRLRRSTGDSWAWYITSTPDNVEEPK